MVHAPQRSVAGVRICILGCESAGASLGGLARLPPAGGEGSPDRGFLERAFQKLLLNFTWWVNREDHEGNNLFAGGFLGLDNIGAFDRSKPLPNGGTLQQADGTAWMAFYCVHMLSMSLELARSR